MINNDNNDTGCEMKVYDGDFSLNNSYENI